MDLRDILARTVSQHSGRNSRWALESPGGFRCLQFMEKEEETPESGICGFQPHWQVQYSLLHGNCQKIRMEALALQHLSLVGPDKLEMEALSSLSTISHLELSMARNLPDVEPAFH
jgi:hypothetical protein